MSLGGTGEARLKLQLSTVCRPGDRNEMGANPLGLGCGGDDLLQLEGMCLGFAVFRRWMGSLPVKPPQFPAIPGLVTWITGSFGGQACGHFDLPSGTLTLKEPRICHPLCCFASHTEHLPLQGGASQDHGG